MRAATLLTSGLDDRNPAGPEDSLRKWVAAGGKRKRGMKRRWRGLHRDQGFFCN